MVHCIYPSISPYYVYYVYYILIMNHEQKSCLQAVLSLTHSLTIYIHILSSIFCLISPFFLPFLLSKLSIIYYYHYFNARRMMNVFFPARNLHKPPYIYDWLHLYTHISIYSLYKNYVNLNMHSLFPPKRQQFSTLFYFSIRFFAEWRRSFNLRKKSFFLLSFCYFSFICLNTVPFASIWRSVQSD